MKLFPFVVQIITCELIWSKRVKELVFLTFEL